MNRVRMRRFYRHDLEALLGLGCALDEGRGGPKEVLVALDRLVRAVESGDDAEYQQVRRACRQTVILRDLSGCVDRIVSACVAGEVS